MAVGGPSGTGLVRLRWRAAVGGRRAPAPVAAQRDPGQRVPRHRRRVQDAVQAACVVEGKPGRPRHRCGAAVQLGGDPGLRAEQHAGEGEPAAAALAERAFEHVVPPQPVRLRLPPELVEAVRAQLAQRELAMPVQCIGDGELQGLRCVVESNAGVLLAGLDEVLARTTQSLETHRRAHSSEGAQEALS